LQIGFSPTPDHPQKMHRYAEEHLDWSVKMKRLKDFLEALVGEDKIKGIPEPGRNPPCPRRPEDPCRRHILRCRAG